MIETTTFFFIAGIVVYIVGVSWLFYLDISYKSNYTIDTNSWYNSTAWAVFLSALGVIVAVVAGMISMILT